MDIINGTEILIPTNSRGARMFRVSADQILTLRHMVLRPGLPLESARFEGDDDPATWHLALTAIASPEAFVCCASYMNVPYKGMPSWQLRGMATHPDHRGGKFGTILLEGAEWNIALNTKIRRFWCNARTSAIPFYEKNSWRVEGEEFDIPGVGPHRIMTRYASLWD